MGNVAQSSFKGGIREDVDATKVPSLGDAYYLGINIRTTKDVVEPVKKPLDLSNTVPEGKLQGIFGAKTFIVLFVDGFAFFKDYADTESGYQKLSNSVFLSPDVDYIYAEFIPGSTVGHARIRTPIKNSDDTEIKSDNVSLDLDSDRLPYRSSVQGLLAQDGLKQAMLIQEDGTVTRISDFGQWEKENNREFVPRGTVMLWTPGGILYSISPDGSKIFHSVSGRPLDHIIAITEEGDKLESEEESLLAHQVDFEPITGLKNAPTENSFIAATKNKTFLVVELLNEEDLQFGEPSFGTIQVAAVGAVNHLCFADLNGDTGVINPNGLHSFNAASVLKQESNNDPISAPINSLFALDNDHKVTQDFPCAKEFGADYSLFAINTVFGRGVLVYDRTTEQFVSLDLYQGVDQIKQFAEIVVNGIRRLFFITVDNKFYEAFAGATYEQSGIIVGEWCSNDPKQEQKPLFCHLVFTECEAEGLVTVTPIINRVHQTPKQERLKVTTVAPTLPIVPPFGGGTIDTTQVVDINLSNIQRGWKIGAWIQWNVKAKLTHISLDTETTTQDVNSNTKARRYANSVA